MKVKNLLLTFAILFIALISGCASDDFEEVEGVCPIVISTIPANGALGVPFRQVISATFNEEMNPSTINSSTFIVTEATGTTIAGTISYSGNTATFTPSAPLTPNTTYTARLKTGVKDVMGNALQTDYVWTFTTGMLIVPMVITTDPAADAVNVALNKTITATFSVPMNPLTLNNSTFIVKQGTTTVAGVITYSGSTVTFTPATPFTPNTVYVVTITNAAKSTEGASLASNYVWSFKTEAAPTVTSTDPTDKATGVPLNKVISATFSVPMDPSTLNSSTFYVKHGTFVVPGVISYSGSTVYFTPSLLVADNDYTVTITTGAKSVSGLALASNYVWNFRTGVTSALVPTVTSTDPANNATGVDVNKTVTANFSMAMDPSTINGTTFTLRQGATVVTGTVSYSGATASFDPTTALAVGTTYTATITTGAKNLAGVAMASNYTWNFTTSNTIIVTPPPVIAGLDFGVFGGNAGITNQGLNTVINGSIGTTAASTLITGFHDGTTGDIYTETPLNKGLVTNRIHAAPPAPGSAASAQIAANGLLAAQQAYLAISPAQKPGGTDPGAGELGGLTLAPGVYKSAGATFKITNGDLTLDAKGDPNAIWIFQTAAGLTVGIAGPNGAKSVKLVNGAQAKNVFWYVGTAAVINGAGGGVMVGTIISTAGITFSTAGNAAQTVLNGRAISLVASVTMVNTTINVPAN